MLKFHRECWNPVKSHSKALVFFAVLKQISIVYSADRGRAEMICHVELYNITIVPLFFCVGNPVNPVQSPSGENGDTIPTTYPWSRPSLEYCGSAIREVKR